MERGTYLKGDVRVKHLRSKWPPRKYLSLSAINKDERMILLLNFHHHTDDKDKKFSVSLYKVIDKKELVNFLIFNRMNNKFFRIEHDDKKKNIPKKVFETILDNASKENISFIRSEIMEKIKSEINK